MRDEEKLDLDLSNADLKVLIDTRAKEILAKRLASIDTQIEETLHKQIDTIIACTLGLENRYGQWSIDHCNGRKTAIAEEIGERVKVKLDECIPQWIEKYFLDPNKAAVLVAKWREPFIKEFSDQLGHQSRMIAYAEAERIATLEAANWIRQALTAEVAEATVEHESAVTTYGEDSTEAMDAAKRQLIATRASAAIAAAELVSGEAK